jgi:hypothetical protein
MASRLKPRLIAGTVAGLAVAGGGAALAADQLGGSPQQESQAVVNDAAKQLGVTPGALSSALKKALENRVDAAVAAGRLTKAQGDELKQHIESGDFPIFGGPGPGLGMHHAFGMFGRGLDAAASYLGLTEAQLRTQLESGKTLADVAKAQNKSVDGLVNALVADAKEKLDAAVKSGRLTKSQESSILSDLKSHITNFVNGTQPKFGFGFRHFDGPRGHDDSGMSAAGPALGI